MNSYNRPLYTECDELVLSLSGEHEFAVLCGSCVEEILTLWPAVEMRSTFNDTHDERCARCGLLSVKGAHFEREQFNREYITRLTGGRGEPDLRDFDTITDEHVERVRRGK